MVIFIIIFTNSLLRLWRIIRERWRGRKESSISKIKEEVGSTFRLYELINFHLRSVWSVKENRKVSTFLGRKFLLTSVNVQMMQKRKVTLVLFWRKKWKLFLEISICSLRRKESRLLLSHKEKEQTHPVDGCLRRESGWDHIFNFKRHFEKFLLFQFSNIGENTILNSFYTF